MSKHFTYERHHYSSGEQALAVAIANTRGPAWSKIPPRSHRLPTVEDLMELMEGFCGSRHTEELMRSRFDDLVMDMNTHALDDFISEWA